MCRAYMGTYRVYRPLLPSRKRGPLGILEIHGTYKVILGVPIMGCTLRSSNSLRRSHWKEFLIGVVSVYRDVGVWCPINQVEQAKIIP